MHRNVFRGLAILTCLSLSLVAHADEILFFTNGTTMPIRSHRIEKGMIHVELGARSSMAFPANMVDRIELSGRPVYGTGATPANQAVANTEVNGRGGLPSRYQSVPASEMPRGRATSSSRVPGEPKGDSPPGYQVTPIAGRLKSAMGGGPGLQPGTQMVGEHSAFSATPPGATPLSGPIHGFGRRPTAAPPSPVAAPAVPADGDGAEAPPEAAPPEDMPEINQPGDDEGEDESPE